MIQTIYICIFIHTISIMIYIKTSVLHLCFPDSNLFSIIKDISKIKILISVYSCVKTYKSLLILVKTKYVVCLIFKWHYWDLHLICFTHTHTHIYIYIISVSRKDIIWFSVSLYYFFILLEIPICFHSGFTY